MKKFCIYGKIKFAIIIVLLLCIILLCMDFPTYIGSIISILLISISAGFLVYNHKYGDDSKEFKSIFNLLNKYVPDQYKNKGKKVGGYEQMNDDIFEKEILMIANYAFNEMEVSKQQITDDVVENIKKDMAINEDDRIFLNNLVYIQTDQKDKIQSLNIYNCNSDIFDLLIGEDISRQTIDQFPADTIIDIRYLRYIYVIITELKKIPNEDENQKLINMLEKKLHDKNKQLKYKDLNLSEEALDMLIDNSIMIHKMKKFEERLYPNNSQDMLFTEISDQLDDLDLE